MTIYPTSKINYHIPFVKLSSFLSGNNEKPGLIAQTSQIIIIRVLICIRMAEPVVMAA